MNCDRCDELAETLRAVLNERDEARAKLAAIKAAYRAYAEARAAYVEGWGTASPYVSSEERAYSETWQRMAELMKGDP